MKVEIWSDIMCPFCYIGKRKFENALNQFDNKNEVEIQWRSFQLAPELKTDPAKSMHEYLAEIKGWSVEYAEDLHNKMTITAKEVGLDYDFDKAVPANSFNAHRLSHLAARHSLQNEAEERLFKAYFTEGQNIDDSDTLIRLGTEIGLTSQDVVEMLKTDLYAKEVGADISRAQQVGVRGVPFFVLDDKYAVSGAQNSEVFLGALQKAWLESAQLSEPGQSSDGASCSIDGDC